MTGVLYVIGAGLAGLACAVAARQAGLRVSLHEAAPHAGGRCRSFFDRNLGRVIDNGTHLILSGNHAVLNHARQVGAAPEALVEHPAVFPFVDLTDGTRWTLRPGSARLPLWLLSPGRRVPGAGLGAHLGLLAPWRPGPTRTVSEQWGRSPLYRRLIEPLSTAILNTEPEAASAALLRRVMDETLGRGPTACRPLLAPQGLDAALIAPALAWLRQAGASLHFSDGLTALQISAGRVQALCFQTARLPLAADDQVVLAVPPTAAQRLLPSLVPPLALRPIVNAHFAVSEQDFASAPPLIGVVGGLAQWIFVRPGVLSVTVSCPGAAAELAAPELAARLWRDVVAALALPAATAQPPVRVIKERRATLAHSPQQEPLRPGPQTPLANLWLAGDWVTGGLPCTLESAVRSGQRAAGCAVLGGEGR